MVARKVFNSLIDVQSLAYLIEHGTCRLVDCRFNLMDPTAGRKQYDDGHIAGALYADLDLDLAGPVMPASGRHPLPDPDSLTGLIRKWGVENGQQVVVYDANNGALAARLWWLFRWLGHEEVAVLDGGLDAWLAADLPMESESPSYPASAFEGSPNPALVATTEEILEAVSRGPEFLLVDARDERRFRGEVEPIDAVAGSIPGSVNLPFQHNMTDDNRWHTPQQLAESWDAIARGKSSADAVVMCGSGVTACHLIVAAAAAGLPLPRLYVGSWSEWIRDPDRPIAVVGRS